MSAEPARSTKIMAAAVTGSILAGVLCFAIWVTAWHVKDGNVDRFDASLITAVAVLAASLSGWWIQPLVNRLLRTRSARTPE